MTIVKLCCWLQNVLKKGMLQHLELLETMKIFRGAKTEVSCNLSEKYSSPWLSMGGCRLVTEAKGFLVSMKDLLTQISIPVVFKDSLFSFVASIAFRNFHSSMKLMVKTIGIIVNQ